MEREDGDASDDELFAELERDIDEHFDMTAMREHRLEELKQEYVTEQHSVIPFSALTSLL